MGLVTSYSVLPTTPMISKSLGLAPRVHLYMLADRVFAREEFIGELFAHDDVVIPRQALLIREETASNQRYL